MIWFPLWILLGGGVVLFVGAALLAKHYPDCGCARKPKTPQSAWIRWWVR